MTKKPISVCLCLFLYLASEAQSITMFQPDGLDSVIIRTNQAYEAAKRSGNRDSLFSSLSSMFEAYLESGDYAKSFDYAEQLYNIAIGSANPNNISISLIALGKLYSAIEDYSHALTYYRRAYTLDVKGKVPFSAARLDLYMADLYAQTSRFDSAWNFYNHYRSRQAIDSVLYLVSIGECLFMQGEYQQARDNFESAIMHPEGQNNVRVLLDLAKVNSVLNNPKAALFYGKSGTQAALGEGTGQYIRNGYKIIADVYEQMGITDSSNDYFRKYVISRDIVLNAQTRGRMEALTYEQEISQISQENRIHELDLQKQVLIRNGLLTGTVLLLLFGFLLSRYLIMKRRVEVRQRQIAESELKIQKLEAEKSKSELEKQKTELEIRALRAQMNPHFIFNCLNSINRFIIGNEALKAADYLTKFAGLIRIVLEKSSASLISLEEELHALTLYMDLEALRFETPFGYTIQYDGIDTSELLIPSLIMQPFVENAIWHGFQASQKIPGHILIQLHLENDHLHCAIRDNGIGISRGNAANQTHYEHRKSLGIQFTTERLRLVAQSESEYAIRVEDLIEEDGKICGTVVYLVIPVSYG
jgi:tetratricopeptide (TPR) repeat protein